MKKQIIEKNQALIERAKQEKNIMKARIDDINTLVNQASTTLCTAKELLTISTDLQKMLNEISFKWNQIYCEYMLYNNSFLQENPQISCNMNLYFASTFMIPESQELISRIMSAIVEVQAKILPTDKIVYYSQTPHFENLSDQAQAREYLQRISFIISTWFQMYMNLDRFSVAVEYLNSCIDATA